jgi:hypothetical protein
MYSLEMARVRDGKKAGRKLKVAGTRLNALDRIVQSKKLIGQMLKEIVQILAIAIEAYSTKSRGD